MTGGPAEYTAPISTRPTIIDVARMAGVAVGTASNALNGKGRVSSETRSRVIQAAETLRFRPHRSARGLPTARTMAIGVRFSHDGIVPAGHFFVDLLAGAAETAAEHGYGLQIVPPGLSTAGMVDGLVVVDPLRAADAQVEPGAEPIPIVTIGRAGGRASSAIPWVDVDHRAAATALLDHLEMNAAPGPAWMVSLPRRYPFIRDLEAAFIAWTRTTEHEAHIIRVPDDPEPAVAAVRDEINGGATPPSLLLAALDRQAVGAQAALRGREVPIGCASDSDLLGVLDPPITALALDGREHGRRAVAMVLEWLQDDAPPASHQLPARLILRPTAAVA
jgi:DNA-binding LacI/PurR family transcriptional regulator